MSMKHPFAQFTVGRMMVSVALLAILLGLGIEGERARRRSRFRSEADEASKQAHVARIRAMGFEERASRPGSHPLSKRMADRERLMADYWERLRDRNERAASRSWASFSPDDPS